MNTLMQQLERAWGKTNLGDPESVQIFLMCFDALWPQIVKSAVQPEGAALPAEPTMGMWDDFMEEWQKHPNDFESFLKAYRVMYANYQCEPQEQR